MNYIETICLIDNQIQNKHYHISRMNSNSTASFPELDTTLLGRVKCRIIYNSTAIISVQYMEYVLPFISSLQIVEFADIRYDRKYEDRSMLDTLYSQRNQCDDIIICRGGVIGDTYFCNLVFEDSKGLLYSSSHPILRGTKLQSLLDRGVVAERYISVEDLWNYRGVYLVNAMIDIQDNVYVAVSNIRQLQGV